MKRSMVLIRKPRRGSAVFAISLAMVGGLTAGGSPRNDQPAGSVPIDFQGRSLVSLSDADMVASAYVDDRLGPRQGRDALSVIPLSGGEKREPHAYETEVSNSVAGAPAALTVTSDGQYAIVAESFGQRRAGCSDSAN